MDDLKQPDRVLIVGYGNPFRRDDGVALYIINRIRSRLAVPLLAADDDGLDDLGREVDSITLHQLLPEMVPILAHYRRVVFVDAHTGVIPEEVRVVEVKEEYGLQAVTHHLSPGMLLALLRKAAGAAPRCWLVSVKGDEFGFGEGLSLSCSTRADRAVDEIAAIAGITPSSQRNDTP